ncbi:MAG: hypothetical protein ACJ796_23720 [Gemmatimonadaceae bacterium]
MQASKAPSFAAAAGRGAIAGLIGGAVMTTAERVVLPRLPGRHAPRIVPWDERISDAADIVGWEMSPRSRTTAGITTQLLYAALLGAAYAAITSRRPSRAARDLADAALVYAASLVAPELPRSKSKRRRPRGRLAQMRQRAIEPISAHKVFGRATTLALKALDKRGA